MKHDLIINRLYSVVCPLSSVLCHLSSAPLHLSRTLYKSPLFMQNKPNLKDAQMNVNIYYIKDYQIFIPLAGYKNKPNSNPIKPNSRKAQMNLNSLITKDYRKKDDFIVRKNKPNSKPISSKPKMSANSLITKDYRKNDVFAAQKTNPIQTQSSQGQKRMQPSLAQRIMKMKPPSGPKKQTQTNPISKQLQGKRYFRWIREFINW